MKCLFCLCLLGVLTTTTYSQSCDDWMEAPYDTSVEDYDNGIGTPRGFRQTSIPNPEIADADEYPCITVRTDDADTQYMQILIQTVQPDGASNICIDVEGIEETTCNSGSTSFCGKVPNEDPVVTFNCDNGCDQSDVRIYYRANLSRSDIDDENWCNNLEQDYPSGLVMFVPPTDITPQTQFTESALGLHSFPFSVVLLLALAVMGIRHVLRL